MGNFTKQLKRKNTTTKTFTDLWVEEFDNLLCTKRGDETINQAIDVIVSYNPTMKHMSRADWLTYILHNYKCVVMFQDKIPFDFKFIPKN